MDVVGTPYASVVARLARDPATPFITDVDLSTGDRVELSVASAANGAAKAAHLVGELAASLGAPPRIALRLPLHWQAVTFALGAWAAGAVLLTGDAEAGADPDAVVLGPDEVTDPPAGTTDADVVWATRLHPFGLPFASAPAFPVEDLTLALRQQPDLPPPDRGDSSRVVLVASGATTTLSELLARATTVGSGLEASDRLLTCLPWTTTDGWVAGVVLPALADHAVVLVRGLAGTADPTGELERLCASERVAATAGVDVAGIPRLC